MTREREGLYARPNYLYVYAGTKCVWEGGGNVITGLYGNMKWHLQYNTVSEYKVYNLLLASPL